MLEVDDGHAAWLGMSTMAPEVMSACVSESMAVVVGLQTWPAGSFAAGHFRRNKKWERKKGGKS